NPPRFRNDMYTPRWIRGCGKNKVGLCPICEQNGQMNCFKLKITFMPISSTSFRYHMNFFHGISSVNGRPFASPVEYRMISDKRGKLRSKNALSKLDRPSRMVQQGQCHVCEKWIYLESPKDLEVNVPEIYWWKHAQKCHKIGFVENTELDPPALLRACIAEQDSKLPAK
ncbi:hypothetical protein K493DRAFT_230829, partial [Basidiobolus meristosporus CBS 931.73]